MEERTADEIAAIFSAAGDSVTLINADANFAAYGTRTSDSITTESEWKEINLLINMNMIKFKIEKILCKRLLA